MDGALIGGVLAREDAAWQHFSPVKRDAAQPAGLYFRTAAKSSSPAAPQPRSPAGTLGRNAS